MLTCNPLFLRGVLNISFKSVKNPEVHSVGSSRRGSHCIVLDEKSNIHALFAYVGTTDAELSLTVSLV